MKRIFWNIAVAWRLRVIGGLPMRIGYGIAAQDDDAWNDGMTPLEVAHNEMSYWEE